MYLRGYVLLVLFCLYCSTLQKLNSKNSYIEKTIFIVRLNMFFICTHLILMMPTLKLHFETNLIKTSSEVISNKIMLQLLKGNINLPQFIYVIHSFE